MLSHYHCTLSGSLLSRNTTELLLYTFEFIQLLLIFADTSVESEKCTDQIVKPYAGTNHIDLQAGLRKSNNKCLMHLHPGQSTHLNVTFIPQNFVTLELRFFQLLLAKHTILKSEGGWHTYFSKRVRNLSIMTPRVCLQVVSRYQLLLMK